MGSINYGSYYERLKRRREEVMATREHLRREQRVVDENNDWLDRAAYESRVDLLGNLSDWYAQEMVQIDDALARMVEGNYGLCVACHRGIEPERLEIAPEAAFCASCQSTRESLAEM